jgi:hypothetical protein
MSRGKKARFAFLSLIASCALLGAPDDAQAQLFPPVTGTVTVLTPSSVAVNVPLALTAQMLAGVNPNLVLFSTSDPIQVAALSLLGFGGDGMVTAGELYTNYPGATIAASSLTASLSGDARFTLNMGTCAAPSGSSCIAQAAYNGASPPGVVNLTVNPNVASATVSGTGNATLESMINVFMPTILAAVDGMLNIPVQVTIAKIAQSIVFGAAPAGVAVGTTGTVRANGGASGNPVTFASTTPSTCSISGATVTGIAAGTCTISANQAGNANYNAAPQVTQSFQVAAANPPRLSNISTRMQVLTGADVMIGGFVIGGSANKTVAIVATGPSLSQYGIANPLANPRITLVRSSDQSVIASNDDWQGGCPQGSACANPSQLTAAGFAPPNPLEAGMYINLAPGAYTTIVEGVGGGTGVSVIGIYEVDGPTIPLINISTRGRVLTGSDVMIGGFVVTGAGSQTVAIVATGPSLGAFGITSPLANPRITLVRASDQAVVSTNDDWQTDPNASQLQAAGFSPSNSLESGLYTTLQPGAYTVIVEGVGGGTGVAVIGVYKVN